MVLKKLFSDSTWIFALLSLLIGIFYYLVFREPILVSTWLGVESYHLQKQLLWLGWLPSFVHQFSFVLLSWLVLEKKYKWFVLSLWLGVNGLFELGQALPTMYVQGFPRTIANYFENGTYSHGDMLAILGATVVAYGVITKYEKERV